MPSPVTHRAARGDAGGAHLAASGRIDLYKHMPVLNATFTAMFVLEGLWSLYAFRAQLPLLLGALLLVAGSMQARDAERAARLRLVLRLAVSGGACCVSDACRTHRVCLCVCLCDFVCRRRKRGRRSWAPRSRGSYGARSGWAGRATRWTPRRR